MRQASSGSAGFELAQATGLVLGTVSLLIVVAVTLATLGVGSPWSLALQTVGAFGGAWWLASRRGWDAARGRRDARDVALAVGVGVGLAVLGIGLLSLEIAASPALRQHVEARAPHLEALLRPDRDAWIPVVVFVVGVLPAVFEERWFRGVVQARLVSWTPVARALAVGVLFGAAHMDPANFGPLVVVGTGFGLLAERTGGWWMPAVAHFTHNVFNGVLVPRVVHADALPAPWALAAVVVGGLIVAATFRVHTATAGGRVGERR